MGQLLQPILLCKIPLQFAHYKPESKKVDLCSAAAIMTIAVLSRARRVMANAIPRHLHPGPAPARRQSSPVLLRLPHRYPVQAVGPLPAVPLYCHQLAAACLPAVLTLQHPRLSKAPPLSPLVPSFPAARPLRHQVHQIRSRHPPPVPQLHPRQRWLVTLRHRPHGKS